MNQSRTIIIIQARMGSTRFPKKMLTTLGKYPLLEWVVQRVIKSKKIDHVVLATTTNEDDDALVDFVKNCGVEVFRGSENDVLDRFVKTAHKFKADLVVRVCADNPFIDPLEIDRLITFFNENQCDYACNHRDNLNSGYADGFGAEIFSANLLYKIDKLAINAMSREHVTLYLWENQNNFKLKAVPAPIKLHHPNLRFDIDSPEDMVFLEKLVNNGVTIKSKASEIINICLLNNYERC